MSNDAVIVFVDNTTGSAQREQLREYLRNTSLHRFLFYSSFVDGQDCLDFASYEKDLQWGEGRGDRIRNAFYKVFELQYDHVLFIAFPWPAGQPPVPVVVMLAALENTESVVVHNNGGDVVAFGISARLDSLFESFDSSDPLLDMLISLRKNKVDYCLLNGTTSCTS